MKPNKYQKRCVLKTEKQFHLSYVFILRKNLRIYNGER